MKREAEGGGGHKGVVCNLVLLGIVLASPRHMNSDVIILFLPFVLVRSSAKWTVAKSQTYFDV